MMPICDECGCASTSGDTSDNSRNLCPMCRDRAVVRKAFNDQLLNLVELERTDPDQAIAILDDIYARYMDRDRDGWLERSVRDQRATILMDNKRYDAALAELRIVEKKVKPESEEFADNKRSIAHVLALSGKPREALDELEAALASRHKLHTGTTVVLLTKYARIADKEGWPVPSIYQGTFKRAVFEWGMPVAAELVESDLTQAILTAAAQRRAAQDRYVALLEELRDKPTDVRARLLREFIEAEPFGYFRDQAKRSLDDGEAPESTEQQE